MTADQDELRGVVAVGASAGGVEALTQMAAYLPAELPFAILVTLHMPPGIPSVLARILDRAGPLPAVSAIDGGPLEPGCIHVCVPDRHLLLNDHRMVLSRGPTKNGHRPAINALFRSTAREFGPRAIGILLSGVLDDGVMGLKAIRSRGGATIAQSPDDAAFPAMPTNALAAGAAHHQVPAAEIGALLKRLSHREIEETTMDRDHSLELEDRIAMARPFADFDTSELGPPSSFTCPDCNGSLAAIRDGGYRCQVGHAWSAEALWQARDQEVEGALWVAVRSLQKKARLAHRLAASAAGGLMQDRFRDQAEEAERALAVLSARLDHRPDS